jgi:RNA polymerase sigma-70 factor, ECF subfamily
MSIASPLALPRPTDQASASELAPKDIVLCQQGNREALGRFVRCYEKRVFAYLWRTLGPSYPIEDLAQEAFVRAYPALKRFETDRSAKLSTWLLTIVHRVAIDARRRNRSVGEPLESERHPSPGLSPEELLGQAELRAAVTRAVEQLTVEQRDVFVLAVFHHLSTAEIAQVVGAVEATVKTRLFRAKSRLKLALGPLHTVIP